MLRTELAPSLLQNVRHNIAHGNSGVRLFEIANVFTADPEAQTTACERARLGVVFYGSLYDAAWPQPETDAGYADVRGIVERGRWASSILMPRSLCLAASILSWAPCVRVLVGGRDVGVIGQLRSQLADSYHARKPIWLAELDLETLWELHRDARIVFRNLPVYPPALRDMTVIAPEGMSVSTIEEATGTRRIGHP